jgi:transposase
VPERYTAAMPDAAQNLPDDSSRLKDMVTALPGECGVLMGELKSRDILIEKLKHQLAGMRQHRIGSRSEALDQLALTLEDEEIAASAQEPAPDDADQAAIPPKGKPKRKPLPGHLPRNETILSPGDSCGEYGGDLKNVGRRCHRGLGIYPGPFCREPDHTSAHDLHML